MPIKAAVRNLSKAYGPVRAVSDLSLEVGGGEILGLLGPNGAGKTTTVETIIGLVEPDAGSVEICGVDARAHPRRARQMIGVALQSTGLQDKITPREALAMFGAFYPSPSDPKMLIERFGLAEKANAAFDTLSGGQRQRLALALAFANDPQVLFLDEPTASLDPQMRRELHGHIRQMREEGRAVLLTTHDMEEAAQLCDRVAVIDAGRIIAQGSPGELIATSQAAVTVTLSTSAPIDPAWTAALPHVGEIAVDAAGARFAAGDLNRVLAELVPVLDAHGVQITALNAGRATLEDVILELTGTAPVSDLSAIARHVGLSLKLNGRNRMALIYGYLFPLIFLLAFWALYRHDRVPLVLHMGELLTVTILGGACFGMPTTMVSERERGVWRRYRTTPAPVWTFIASTLVSRYLLLISAALTQIALAMAIGMPAPAHPLGLFVAFTVACVAFLGLGMVIAMLADNVPAVQALGQCIFLPMLIIGGVAVRLSSLPDWALQVSAFFPGRYAVKALQDSVTRGGLTDSGFELLALLLIGAAGGLAAAMMFRWDVKQKLAPRRGKAWLLLALGMWAVVGLMAQAQGRVAAGPEVKDTEDVGASADYVARPAPIAAQVEPAAPPPKTEPTPVRAKIDPPPPAPEPASWRTVTPVDFKRVAFERLPPDSGVISPVASTSEEVDPAVADQIDKISAALETWAPGQVADPIQRARNLLYVAAVPDVLQMEGVERVLPLVVLERLKATTPAADLPKILYWVAMHPGDGDDAAASQLDQVGLPLVKGSTQEARGRVMIYAFKLLGRLTGDIPS